MLLEWIETLGPNLISWRVVDVRDLPVGEQKEDNLSRYIRVTPQGHRFIALREQALREEPPSAL